MKIIGRKHANDLLARGTAKFLYERNYPDCQMTFGVIKWRDENYQYLLRKGRNELR